LSGEGIFWNSFNGNCWQKFFGAKPDGFDMPFKVIRIFVIVILRWTFFVRAFILFANEFK
jgi:hypothetical protein